MHLRFLQMYFKNLRHCKYKVLIKLILSRSSTYVTSVLKYIGTCSCYDRRLYLDQSATASSRTAKRPLGGFYIYQQLSAGTLFKEGQPPQLCGFVCAYLTSFGPWVRIPSPPSRQVFFFKFILLISNMYLLLEEEQDENK